MIKPAYSIVKLRITSWEGEPSEVGDELRTATGRRYQIVRINGKTHHCLILPPEAEVQGKVFSLVWNKRRKNRGLH